MRAVALGLMVGLAGAGEPPRLPDVFGDHMVLQRGGPIHVWGWAEAGEAVTVEIAGRSVDAVAGGDGRWLVSLPAMTAGGPFELTVVGDDGSVVFGDVLIGDVWIASGQSNMEWPLRSSNSGEVSIAAAGDDGLRMIKMTRRASNEPQDETESGGWMMDTPETAAGFSAVAYSFGRELRREVGVPIGLVQSAWGGTPAEAWTPLEDLEAVDELAPIVARIAAFDDPDSKASGRPATRPAALYNGMIHPMKDLSAAGVIWYQGESNANRAVQYRVLFTTMIEGWRRAMGRDLPFFFVQLANFQARQDEPSESSWAELREAQAMALRLPDTGMACIIDIGAADNIHPRNKADVGHRLALEALRVVHGRDIVSTGPMLARVEFGDGRAVVRLSSADGLGTTDGLSPVGFAIAQKDGPFVWAAARIEGAAVVLTADGVDEPAAVRYGWADNPAVNLVNGAGLPAVPFRTDDRREVTAGNE